MALTIDELQIKIESDAKKATGGIDALASSLEKLQQAMGGASSLASNLSQIADAMKSLGSVGKLNLAAPIRQLSKFNDIAPTLGSAQATQMASNLREIASALTAFSAVPKISITPIANGIKNLNDATATLDNARLAKFAEQMKGIAAGLSNLSNIGRSNVGSIVSAVKKIPEITNSLDPETISAFASRIQELTRVMTPLGVQMDSIARGFNALPNAVRRTIRAFDRASTSTRNTSKAQLSLAKQLSQTAKRFRNLWHAVQKVADVFSLAFGESNKYIESLNLFRVTMGDAADDALELANVISDTMGIDVAEWITNQGMFMRMATGFGMATDQAELMSQNLTQLSYDMSSFFNVDVETAMDKLQSGMSGQIKGLKEYGYNLSVAALQETALSLGIEESVRNMTEAQKAQLRYITLIQKSKGVMGDMAKTITTPSNSMRILEAQLTRLQRAFGNIVSVLVTQFIPWIMAAVELMEELAISLAEAWGFEIPDLPENNLDMAEDVIEGIGDETDDTSDKLSELKKQLMGFDELNILKSDSGDEDTPTYDLGIELPEYDFLSGLEALDLEPYKQALKDILAFVGEIGLAFLAWKVSKGVLDFFDMFVSNKFSRTLKNLKVPIGITLMASGFALEFNGAYDLGYEGVSLKNILKAAIGSALGVAGSLLVFGTGPVGWTIGLGIAITTFITGVSMGTTDKKFELLSTKFYDVLGKSIDNVRESLKKYFEALDFDKNREWTKKIEESEEAYRNARTAYDEMWKAIVEKPEFDASDIEGLTKAFNDLASAAANLNNTKIDSIMQSIKTGIENNITPALSEQLGGLLDKLKEAHVLIGAEISGLNAKYQETLNEVALNGGVATESQKAELKQLREQLTKFVLSEDSSAQRWEVEIKSAIEDAINAGTNKEAVLNNVNDLMGDRDEYLASLKEKYAADLNTLTQLIEMDQKEFGGQLGFSSKDLELLEKSYEAQLTNVKARYDEVLDAIINTYEQSFKNAVDGKYEQKYGWEWFDKLVMSVGVPVFDIFASGDYTANSKLYREYLELIEKLKKLKIGAYASGGFPSVGE